MSLVKRKKKNLFVSIVIDYNDMCQLYWVKKFWILSSQPQHYSYPSIFIYGHRASGKSHVMQVLLKELEVRARHLLSVQQSLLRKNRSPSLSAQREGVWLTDCFNLLNLKQMLTWIVLSFLHQISERVFSPWKYYVLLKVQKGWQLNSINIFFSISVKSPFSMHTELWVPSSDFSANIFVWIKYKEQSQIVRDPSHPLHPHFELLPSGKRYGQVIATKTNPVFLLSVLISCHVLFLILCGEAVFHKVDNKFPH